MQPLRAAPASRGKVQAIRTQMATTPGPLRLLLKQVGALDLKIPADHPLELVLATLGEAYDERNPGLMPWDVVPFPQAQSAALQAASTPAERLAAYEVATAMLLKRSLRNGSVSAPHSVHHRSVADQLMPVAQWQKARPQAMRDNRWTTSIDSYLHRFDEDLSQRATMLHEAIDAGDLSIADGRFRIPKLEALPKDPVLDQTRTALFAAIGSVQLPDVIVAVDACTGFSSLLLGRDAAGKEELEALYAALLAMGTDKTAAEMARMVDGVSDDRIELAMRAIEEKGYLRAASDAVAAAMLAHPIAAQWGSGVAASADMMSLDATRKLWLARIEPRRRGPAVGTYTHVSDWWAVIYDQSVLLNERQGGVAIEGALKQKVCELHSAPGRGYARLYLFRDGRGQAPRLRSRAPPRRPHEPEAPPAARRRRSSKP